MSYIDAEIKRKYVPCTICILQGPHKYFLINSPQTFHPSACNWCASKTNKHNLQKSAVSKGIMFSRFGRCYRACLGAVYFCIVDLDKKKVPDTLFYLDVTNEMKRDMKEAIGRLIGNNAGYTFSYRSNSSNAATACSIVDGKKRSPHEGFKRDLSLRIDIQEYFKEVVENKSREFAKVQIQVNRMWKYGTIAQVNFECGGEISAECIRRAFEVSCKEKKILYVVIREFFVKQ